MSWKSFDEPTITLETEQYACEVTKERCNHIILTKSLAKADEYC